MGTKISNKLPSYLKELVESPNIQENPKKYFVSHCFSKLEEFYGVNS
jgi:hypothetical protein